MPENEPKVLYGPWTPEGCNYPLRIVRSSNRSGVSVEEGWRGAWSAVPHGHWAVAAELARVVAENAELRSMHANHREGLEAELKETEAERDRLRPLAATGRALAEHVVNHRRAGFGLGDEEHRLAHERLERAEILIADPDGIASAEWLEAEKAKIRKEALEFERVQLLSCAELPLGSPDRSLTSIVATISAKAVEPWKALACNLMDLLQRHAIDPAVALARPDWTAELDGARRWLVDREAKARARGQEEGRQEFAEQHEGALFDAVESGELKERSRCAALVREAGCACGKVKAVNDRRNVHGPSCPEALASRIEAGEVDRS